jgi:hypothetical protein
MCGGVRALSNFQQALGAVARLACRSCHAGVKAMSELQEFSALVGDIYDASLDPPLWSGVLEKLTRFVSGHHATVFVENGIQSGSQGHIRRRYDRYIGECVMHCHILDHEDGGMMMNVRIVPDLSAPGGGVGMAGMKHQP